MRDDPARVEHYTQGACGMISAIILAAGESKRMGQPKMLLRWGDTTVLGHVISTFLAAGVDDVLVVVGGAHEKVDEIVHQNGARSIYNPDYANGEMILSLQYGIRTQSPQVQAVLIGLGDQPQIQEETVRSICKTFQSGQSGLIVPSFQMKRGHPWLVARSLWNEILEMDSHQSPRDFMNEHAQEIEYVNVTTSSILSDLDTLEEYRKARP
jgi:molybdenum cofactor cytidylyltransferase